MPEEDATPEEVSEDAAAVYETPPAEEVRPEVLETIEVRVGTIPGKIFPVVVNGGRTAGNALRGAGLSVGEGTEIRVNGKLADEETVITHEDTILTVQRICGN